MPNRSRWQQKGFVPHLAFKGHWACNFSMVNQRDDGLFVVTLGDYRTGGKPELIDGRYHYVTWVFLVEPEEVEDGSGKLVRKAKRIEFDRASCGHWEMAESQHRTMLDIWEHREADPETATEPREEAYAA